MFCHFVAVLFGEIVYVIHTSDIAWRTKDSGVICTWCSGELLPFTGVGQQSLQGYGL